MAEKYLGAFIAMTVLACIFFLVLVVIVVIWCKGRRKVEVKTVTIQPKKKSTIITKAIRQTNGETRAANTSKSADDEEAIIGAEQTTLQPVELEAVTVDEVAPSAADDKQEPTENTSQSEVPAQSEEDKKQDDQSQHSHEDINQSDAGQSAEGQSAETEKPDDETEKAIKKTELVEGHTNPTFQDDETDQS